MNRKWGSLGTVAVAVCHRHLTTAGRAGGRTGSKAGRVTSSTLDMLLVNIYVEMSIWKFDAEPEAPVRLRTRCQSLSIFNLSIAVKAIGEKQITLKEDVRAELRSTAI